MAKDGEAINTVQLQRTSATLTISFPSIHSESLSKRIDMTQRYLFVFAQVHEEFRIPELLSIAELNGIEITFPCPLGELDLARPFMVLGLENDEAARLLARRCILIK